MSIVLDAGVFTVGTVLVIMIFVRMAHRVLSVKGNLSFELKSGVQESSTACMTPLVTKRDICPSAKL